MADIRKAGPAVAAAAPAEVARAATLPFGGDKWGRDVLKKTIKGSETSIFVGLAAALLATFLGTLFGAVAGYYGGWVDDVLQLVLQRVHLDSLPAADPRRRRGAAAEGHADDRPDPRAHRLDRRLPPDPRRVPEAQGARVRAGGRRHRRVERARACSSTSSRTSATSCWCSCRSWSSRFIKSEVILSFLGFGVPVDVVSWGIDAERGAERADPRQVVAARRRGHGDGGAGDRVQPVHRRAARRARSEAEGRPGDSRPRGRTQLPTSVRDLRAAVRVRNLRVSFRTDRPVSRRSRASASTSRANSTVALVGESGSGKSVTSLRSSGLLPPENAVVAAGSEILYGGRNLVGLRAGGAARAARHRHRR